MLTLTPSNDLAGQLFLNPNFVQTLARIRQLMTQYLSIQCLNQHLVDLPSQLDTPKPRPWKLIRWKDINQTQIIGVNPDIFLAILMGALETEAPIRGYTQTSRQYLQPIHPLMAKYVGGHVTEDHTLLEPGLWEKEERQHTPALLKVYRQLMGGKPDVKSRTVRTYQPTTEPTADLYRHGVHRIATEYSAVCLYLWMMAHTTGALQTVFAELVQDEINHMTKFWGFGLWLFPETHLTRTTHILSQMFHQSKTNESSPHRLLHTIKRMMGVLHWQHWSLTHQAELATTFIQVLYRLHGWSDRLSPEDLNRLLGESPICPQS